MSFAVNAQEARKQIEQGDALLVCAYDDEEKCSKLNIDQAMPMSRFRDKLDDIPKSRPLVFFCA